ncbi:MAG TPA: GIY-YIG nuclease family protein [Candidatus Angelobacter sp.]|nr:GIY-YIG nuclease family protein [Candidatus Angelobacter sp.]
MKTYFVYIMSNKSRRLYTGITSRLYSRVFQHKTKCCRALPLASHRKGRTPTSAHKKTAKALKIAEQIPRPSRFRQAVPSFEVGLGMTPS